MIRSIGFQKFMALFVMLLLLAVFAAYWFYVLTPDIDNKRRQLAMNTSSIAEMTENMTRLQEGLARFEKQKDSFEKIKKLGFFDPQNRPETRERLSAMQKEARLLSARFSIKSAVTEKNEKALEAGYKILNTDIDFTLEAIEDADIYRFVYLMNYGFPGQILIKELSITRETEVTQPILRKIGVGEGVPLVKALLRVEWRTMVPDATLTVTTNSDEEGGSY